MKKYTQSHEWIEINDGIGIVGISEYAQKELGDIVYVELPKIGSQIQAGEEVVVLESTKAAADVYSPISGEIIAVNEELVNAPEKVNLFPEGDGWLFKIKLQNSSECDRLLEQDVYLAMVK